MDLRGGSQVQNRGLGLLLALGVAGCFSLVLLLPGVGAGARPIPPLARTAGPRAPSHAPAQSVLTCTQITAFSADVPQPIPDETTITSTLVITSGPIIDSVEVIGMVFAHPYPGDLEVH